MRLTLHNLLKQNKMTLTNLLCVLILGTGLKAHSQELGPCQNLKISLERQLERITQTAIYMDKLNQVHLRGKGTAYQYSAGRIGQLFSHILPNGQPNFYSQADIEVQLKDDQASAVALFGQQMPAEKEPLAIESIRVNTPRNSTELDLRERTKVTGQVYLLSTIPLSVNASLLEMTRVIQSLSCE